MEDGTHAEHSYVSSQILNVRVEMDKMTVWTHRTFTATGRTYRTHEVGIEDWIVHTHLLSMFINDPLIMDDGDLERKHSSVV